MAHNTIRETETASGDRIPLNGDLGYEEDIYRIKNCIQADGEVQRKLPAGATLDLCPSCERVRGNNPNECPSEVTPINPVF